MNKIFIILSILLISNTASAISLKDLKKELEKTGNEIKKELENNNQDSSTSESVETKIDNNEDTTVKNTNNSEFINLPKSKYLTIEAFKKGFDNKILVLNKTSNGPNSTDLILKIKIDQLSNVSNYEQSGVNTDYYYKENGKWAKEQLIIYYWEDAFFCDSMARKNCVSGGMGFQMDAFDYIFGVMKGDQKNIGNTVTSKAGYKLIPTYVVQEGDVSYNPEQWRLISPNRSNDAEYTVIEISEDESIIAQLENDINARTVEKVETKKKNEVLKTNQIGFNNKISLQCIYTTTNGSVIEQYQFNGKDVIWQNIPLELGVPFSEGDDTFVLVTREGKSSIIKTKLKNSGMIINYTINTQNLLAEYIIEGLNFKVQGICNRV
tara:strand:+ start:831 stop:1967 length:1137 start_codon:yes stop_codon:yes gene_type:complete